MSKFERVNSSMSFSLRFFMTGCLVLLVKGFMPPATAQDYPFSQMVLPFSSEKEFTWDYNPADNSLQIEIKGVTPDEIEPVNRYDERVIRRVLIRDMGGAGTAVRLFLRNEWIRVVLNKYDEPFRISIDIFDRRYHEIRDPATGMPLIADQGTPVTQGSPAGGQMQGQSRDYPVSSGSRTGVLLRPPENRPPTVTQGDQPGKRRLLQPVPEKFRNPEQLMAALGKISAGKGGFWKKYPVYLYRIPPIFYMSGKNKKQFRANINSAKAMSSMESMAHYGAQLFDHGHEGKALVAYQQVLHKSPAIFDKRPDHIWRLAEIHLGRGNLTLADGYYQALREKHPDHPLRRFASLRRLDIRALRALSNQDLRKLQKLPMQLEKIEPGPNTELRAQINLRRAYWSPPKLEDLKKLLVNRHHIPALGPETLVLLEQSASTPESATTAFLTATLLLNDSLSGNHKWSAETGEFTGKYFKKYTGSLADPFRKSLRAKFNEVFNQHIQKLVDANKYLKATRHYENLPANLRNFPEMTKTTWSMGEAYRHLGQPDKARHFYAKAARNSKKGPDRFRSWYWAASTTSDALTTLSNNEKADIRRNLQKSLATADRNIMNAWKSLSGKEKSQIYVSMKTELERLATRGNLLRSPPEIVLAAWTRALGTETKSPDGKAEDLAKTYSPTAATISLMTDLSQRFRKLGMTKESRQSLELLTKMKPSGFGGNDETRRLWAAKLLSLAEEYRQENRYLKAGRLYSLAGDENENGVGRAESYYKGGLLLFRAGRRKEAIDALTKASQDGNSLFYSDLAKKRLVQLQQ